MKLNKRTCRKAAAKPLSLPAGHGLLVAEQIDHLIKAEIHNLGHTRTLILYLYPRQQCVQGNRLPKWTIFFSRREFITMRRDEDGKAVWLLSMLDRLDCSYRFLSRCAFCTRRDEQLVFRFVGEKDSSVPALNSLYRFQRRLWEKRTHQQRVRRDHPVVERMRAVRALPRGLPTWVRQNVMPAYLFYDRTGRKRVQAYCTSCQQNVWLNEPKNNRQTVCPYCGRVATQRTRASRARWHEDKETVQVAQMEGEVSDVYPKLGELVGAGSPIMSISIMNDLWGTFNVREDQLEGLKVGDTFIAYCPAFNKDIRMKVYYIKDEGSYAVWKATKSNGQYDLKTFEVKARAVDKLEGLRPGMSLIIKR